MTSYATASPTVLPAQRRLQGFRWVTDWYVLRDREEGYVKRFVHVYVRETPPWQPNGFEPCELPAVVSIAFDTNRDARGRAPHAVLVDAEVGNVVEVNYRL